MDLLVSTSIVASFIAGIAALFAPCCLTVLLPSYFGSVFKERYKVLLMTFIFFLGILTVFLPIGLGAAALSQLLNRYHTAIFTSVGVMLALLGLAMILGKNLSIPFYSSRSTKDYNVSSVYILGISSAIATTCCAPVLAGVLGLSLASKSLVWGGVYTLSYVLGMVAPLFFIAVWLDKINFTEKLAALRRPKSLRLFGREFRFILAELIVGIVFLLMGAYVIYRALTNTLFMNSPYQLTVNIYTAKLVNSLSGFIKLFPEGVWIAIVIGIFILLSAYIIKQFKKRHDE